MKTPAQYANEVQGDGWLNSDQWERVRDLFEQAMAEAEARGRRAALEEAARAMEEAEVERLRETLRAFAERGIHADTCPERIHRIDEPSSEAEAWYQLYLERVDKTVREIASRALAPSLPSEPVAVPPPAPSPELAGAVEAMTDCARAWMFAQLVGLAKAAEQCGHPSAATVITLLRAAASLPAGRRPVPFNPRDTRVYDPTNTQCSCTFEERDSACAVHPSCEECGESTSRMVRTCAEHMTAPGKDGGRPALACSRCWSAESVMRCAQTPCSCTCHRERGR